MNIPLSSYFVLLKRYLQPQRGRVIALALAILIGIGLEVAAPQVVRAFIDHTLAGAPVASLVGLALGFIALMLSRQAATLLSTWLGESVGWTATNALRADLALHCLMADMSFHNARTPGELIERVDGDTTALASFFSQFVIQILGGLLLMTGILAVLLGLAVRRRRQARR